MRETRAGDKRVLFASFPARLLASRPVDVVRLTVPGSLHYRDVAVRTVSSVCKLVQGTRDGVDHEIVSAFSEAFNNVVIHGYEGGLVREIEIEVVLGESSITVHLRDFGKSFDFSSVPLPSLDDLPESGLGVFIIRSFMDDVRYVSGSPNVLSMTKRLTGPLPRALTGSAKEMAGEK